MAERLVYFDNANATFLDDEVVSFMQTILELKLGNPSSHIHSLGIRSGAILDQARERVSALFDAKPQSIVFTSGATESNNLALSGFLKANPNHRLIVSQIEHFSVLNQANRIRSAGGDVLFLNVDGTGAVDLGQLEESLTKGPALVSLASANPEIGTLQPIDEVGQLCRKFGSKFHCDATAGAAIEPIDVVRSNIDLLTVSGSNMYALSGIGALYVRETIRIRPLLDGGNQEFGVRPGTENVVGAAALGKACEIIKGERENWRSTLGPLGNRLWDGLCNSIPFIHLTGHPIRRLAGHVSFWIEHIEGESLLLMLNMKGIMAASGSACSSNLKGKNEEDLAASQVLTAIGVPRDICAGSITFSLAKYNTRDEVDYALEVMPGIVEKLLAMSPSYSDYVKNNVSKTRRDH
jgi:cysteine desulfurase